MRSAELERVADLVMPGWRALEVKRQELRGMVVANACRAGTGSGQACA